MEQIDLDKFLARFRIRFDELIHFVPIPLCFHYYGGRTHIENELETLKLQRRIQIITRGEVNGQPLDKIVADAQGMICQMEVGAFAFQGTPIIHGIASVGHCNRVSHLLGRSRHGEYRLITEAQIRVLTSVATQLLSLGYTPEVLHQLSLRPENQLQHPTLRNFRLSPDEKK